MAASDYGFVVAVNNKILYGIERIGDDEFYVDIYKYSVGIYVNGEMVRSFNSLRETTNDGIYTIYYHRKKYEKYSLRVKVHNVLLHFKRKDDGCILLKFKYKDDMYKVVYGYGVGYDVKNWWKIFLGLDKKKYNEPLKYLKHLKW